MWFNNCLMIASYYINNNGCVFVFIESLLILNECLFGVYIYIYIYCLYFNPLTLNPSSVLGPSHMRRTPYVRGATGRVLLLEDLINFLTCTYRSSWISILKEKKLINPTNHTCFKSIVNKSKPFFFMGFCCCCCCCCCCSCCCGFK